MAVVQFGDMQGSWGIWHPGSVPDGDGRPGLEAGHSSSNFDEISQLWKICGCVAVWGHARLALQSLPAGDKRPGLEAGHPSSNFDEVPSFGRVVAVVQFGDMRGFWGIWHAGLSQLRKKTGVTPVHEGAGTANTALVYHANKLMSLHEGDLPYAVCLLPPAGLADGWMAMAVWQTVKAARPVIS